LNQSISFQESNLIGKSVLTDAQKVKRSGIGKRKRTGEVKGKPRPH
jgi:hypothetical protein